MAAQTEPECGGSPDECGADDGNDGEKGDEHAHEDGGDQSGELEGEIG